MELSIKANNWLRFVSNCLLSSIIDQYITIERDIIMGCIMDNTVVDPIELIVEMIMLRSKQSGTQLPSLSFILLLFFKHKVSIFIKLTGRLNALG